jgi:predicted amidohydrolase
MAETKSIKVVQVQMNPIRKDTLASLAAASHHLQNFSAADNIDLVIFPELCFSGYFFADHEDVAPVLEYSNEGPTFDFCSAQAIRLESYVICSYPEKDRLLEKTSYISQMVIGPDGALLKSYRKHLLWMPHDDAWATAGPGWETFDLKNRQGVELKVGLGVCNDLWAGGHGRDPRGLARFWRDHGCDVIAFSSNLPFAATQCRRRDHETDELWDSRYEHTMMANWWLGPLQPLYLAETPTQTPLRPCVALMTNRCGGEDFFNVRAAEPKTQYMQSAGCSVILKFSPAIEVLSQSPLVHEKVTCLDIKIC